ncbi:hypothetical protein PSG76_09810 [Enterococcus faecalis]|uniref:hypothetical protein n=1 Tax=Enterococcus faecalis TaxID=1351 RepID=UPI00294743A3|nr:hypothetical protein [Enterococcus faecalis]ELS0448355.1 hypothetical protein [Enterococcus faecalis]MDV7769731.1 hypothetical protein [Enterococcus faecalis]
MKKTSIILLCAISLTLISACSTNTKEETSQKSSDISSSTTINSSQSTTEVSEDTSNKLSVNEQFDSLPQEVKIVLIADIVDARVREYPNLEGLTLLYCIDGNDFYLQITSGVGSGHPIYKLTMTDDGITPVQGISYLGIDGYKEVEIEKQLISKETLIQTYNDRKADIDNSSKKVKEDSNLKTAFAEQVSYISNNTQPSDNEIINYFVNFILDDVGDSNSKQYDANYGTDENGLPMIRYSPAGKGAYATIEGNKIIYTGYSFGGVDANGTVSKNYLYKAYYDFITGEHGTI